MSTKSIVTPPGDVIDLSLPMSKETAQALQLGQMITVSGPLFTGRSLFHIRAIRDDVFPPLDYEAVNCFFHVGPVMRQADDGWHVVSVEPTSSIRFERYAPDVIRRFGLRTLIGKTTMGRASAAALRDVGGVYLSKVGICGNFLAKQITRIREVHFLDELGKTEATWVLEVERFGPFFVAIDAQGNSYFEQLARETDARMPSINQELQIPRDFQYTPVNPTGCVTSDSGESHAG